jgi:hypothetical protein
VDGLEDLVDGAGPAFCGEDGCGPLSFGALAALRRRADRLVDILHRCPESKRGTTG